MDTVKNVWGEVSAGQLRDIGFSIPETIPDCAMTNVSDIRMEMSDLESPEDGVLKFNVSMDVSAFKWITFIAKENR